jgi:hypothetical protein
LSSRLLVLTLHGMGDTPRDYEAPLVDGLRRRLSVDQWARVHVEPVFYQDILQGHQRAVLGAMSASGLRWRRLREFLLFGFSDAAGLERKPHLPGSPYLRCQERILAAIERGGAALGDLHAPIVVVAHSLGCQVISNYIWDSQATSAHQGVWKGTTSDGSPADSFRRLKTLRLMFTAGCNIPIFLAGYPPEEIVAVQTRTGGYDFSWRNYFDRDDALGWPLRPLSPSYGEAVEEDVAILSGGGILGTLVSGWNPLSHGRYWKEGRFLGAVATGIERLLS